MNQLCKKRFSALHGLGLELLESQITFKPEVPYYLYIRGKSSGLIAVCDRSSKAEHF